MQSQASLIQQSVTLLTDHGVICKYSLILTMRMPFEYGLHMPLASILFYFEGLIGKSMIFTSRVVQDWLLVATLFVELVVHERIGADFTSNTDESGLPEGI